MKCFSKFIFRISGFTLVFCLLVGMTFLNPVNTEAQSQIGSAKDNGITLTINDVSRFENGQRLRVDYTIHSISSPQINKNTGSPMESPHIWLGDTLTRGHSVSFKKIGEHDYKGTIVAQLHQYRPQGTKVTFNTYSILNQRGHWKVDFYLEGI